MSSVITPLNREIDFDFDFDSFVRGVRAGEAKLSAGVRDVMLLSLGLPTESSRPPSRALFAQHLCAGMWVLRDLVYLLRARGASFVRRHVGFKVF